MRMHAYACVCMRMHAYACVCTCMHACVHACVCMHACACIHACMHVCMYVVAAVLPSSLLVPRMQRYGRRTAASTTSPRASAACRRPTARRGTSSGPWTGARASWRPGRRRRTFSDSGGVLSLDFPSSAHDFSDEFWHDLAGDFITLPTNKKTRNNK